MSKYTQNQSIEKAGWAGGYVLDAQRQTEYLKQSIKAQMYGQMELQAMGYDSQLAAARLAYDLGKQDLARQYYQDAVANQIQKAQLTGVWVSPEVDDMLTQSQAASAILIKKEGLSDEEKLLDKEYQQARHLKDQIVNWFAQTGLSETGVDTLAKMTFNLDVQALNESKIQAALEAIEPGQYAMKNEDGSYKINKATGRPEIIDLNVASPNEQWDFFNTSYGHIALRNQINNLASQTMQNFINNNPGLSDMSDSQFQTAFDNYLKSGTNDLVKDYVNQFGSNDIMQRLINTHPEVFVDGQYTFSIKSGDDTYTYKFNKTTGTGGTDDGTITTPTTVDAIENHTNTDDLLDTLTNPELEGGVSEVVDLILNTDFESMGTSDWNNFWDDFFITGIYLNAFGSGNAAKRTAAEINSILKQIDTAIGPDNMALMVNKNIEWNKLTDREKSLLSTVEKASYERNEAFITHYLTMKEVLKEAEMNDSNIFSGGWKYTADVWKRNAELWKDVDNFAEGANAILDSVASAAATFGDTIVSVIRGLFGDWWK